MRKDLFRGSIAILVFTLLLGVAYPLAMTAISQVAFGDRANGSLIRQNGKVVGSHLLARDFSRPLVGGDGAVDKGTDGDVVTEPDPRYFQARPSVTGYSATVTYFPNRGPNQESTRDLTRQHLAAYLALERRYSPGLEASQVPVDAVTFSASGVDPDISVANAAIQSRRVAAVRRLPLARVRQLISANTAGRGLGVFGEPGVNVTDLNLALDREAR